MIREQPILPTFRPRIEVALVNNMPDTAFAATQRQFAGLLAEAAGEAFEVRLRLYALDGVPRSELARAAMADSYAGLETLRAVGADALIVTGAEPHAADLRDEPYWGELARLIDWAREETCSTLFSCLAAHAAVLHLDGVQRRRLPAKASGVFTVERRRESPLAAGLGASWRTPHSRWNALAEDELETRGYRVLSASPAAGVDLFTREARSLLVFLQGHPEYDPDSLLKEYRRDLGRCLRGEKPYAPRPRGYFDAATEAALEAAVRRAPPAGGLEPLRSCDLIAARFRPEAVWRPTAVRLFRNWLQLVAAAQQRRHRASAAVSRAAGASA